MRTHTYIWIYTYVYIHIWVRAGTCIKAHWVPSQWGMLKFSSNSTNISAHEKDTTKVRENKCTTRNYYIYIYIYTCSPCLLARSLARLLAALPSVLARSLPRRNAWRPSYTYYDYMRMHARVRCYSASCEVPTITVWHVSNVWGICVVTTRMHICGPQNRALYLPVFDGWHTKQINTQHNIRNINNSRGLGDGYGHKRNNENQSDDR